MFKVDDNDTRKTPLANSEFGEFSHSELLTQYPAGKKCSKLTIETLEQGVKYVQS